MWRILRPAVAFLISVEWLTSIVQGNNSIPLAPEAFHDLSGANCGINVVCEAFYLNNQSACTSVFLDQIAALNLQGHLFSLAEIGNLLEDGGLSASAVKGCPLGVLLSQLNSSDFAIIHTKDIDGTHNHFLILTSSPKPDSFSVFDFPQPKVTVNATDLVSKYKAAFSGDALLVSSSNKAGASVDERISGDVRAISDADDKAAQDIQSDQVADDIPLSKGPSGFSYQPVIKLQRDVNDVSKLIGICTLDNEGDDTVAVTRAHGSCSCFQKAVGIHDIPRKRILTFSVIFDADRFDRTHGSQILLSTVLAGKNKDFLIKVVADNPKILTSVVAVPSTIDFLNVSNQNLHKLVNVYVADDPAKLKAPVVTTTSSFLTAQITNVRSVHLNRQFMTCYSIMVDLNMPGGAADTVKKSFVQVVYSDKSLPVRLPIVLTSNL